MEELNEWEIHEKEYKGKEDIPGFFSILPFNVLCSDKLSDKSKLIFGVITTLSHKHGFCFATNKYIAKLFNTCEMTVSRAVKDLEKNGFIKVTYKKVLTGTLRHIYPVLSGFSEPLNKNVESPSNKNVETPLNKNVEHININNINTSNNNNILQSSDCECEKDSVNDLKNKEKVFLKSVKETYLDSYKNVKGKDFETLDKQFWAKFNARAKQLFKKGYTLEDMTILFMNAEKDTWISENCNFSFISMTSEKMITKYLSPDFKPTVSKKESQAEQKRQEEDSYYKKVGQKKISMKEIADNSAQIFNKVYGESAEQCPF